MTREEMLKLSALLGLGAMLPKDIHAIYNEMEQLKASDFGKNFIWGTATAAYQIEGAWNIDGKGPSIWDEFTQHRKNKIKTHENGNVACDFYHRYPEDIAMMKELNFDASRFSIAWSRVLPNGIGQANQKGIDYYKRVIEQCHKNNIAPWITCYHWDLPQALQKKGGWENRDILNWFEEYVNLCAKEFGDGVKDWMVFNEPMAFTALGYLIGMHAPGKMGINRFVKTVHHATMCHAIGGKALRAGVKEAQIGTTFSCGIADAWKGLEKNEKARKRIDVMLNRLFIEPVLGMGYPTTDLPGLKRIEKYIQPGDMDKITFDFDFIGLQNYTRSVVKQFGIIPFVHALNIPPKKLGHDITEMNWEVYPEGMYRIIKQFAEYKQIKKFYITENGVAFKDEMSDGKINDTKRIQFFKDYLAAVLKAKKEGVNIGGYFVWSFMDNFEWAEGFRPRFGLVNVDFETQKRTIKESGKWFQTFLTK